MFLIVALVFAFQAAAQQTPIASQPGAPTVVGDWDLTFATPLGSNVARVTFKQDDDLVTASLAVPLGTVQLSGHESADGTLKMSGTAEFQGTSLALVLGARLAGDAITGLITLGTLGELPFTGKRHDEGAQATDPAVAAAPSDPSTVSGKWNVTLTLGNMGTFPISAVLDQQGDRITGILNSPLGPLAVSGTMDGGNLQLECVAETPQGNITVTMTGQFGPDGLRGKATVVPFGDAEWTGTREK